MQAEYSGSQGPSWADVHDYVTRLQTQHNVAIVFSTRFYEVGKPPRRIATVVAEARRPDRPTESATRVGSHQFRGNNGAASMSGAYWHALSELEGRLEGIEKVAQTRMPF